MALRSVLKHYKILMLAELLDVPKPYAIGLMESLWLTTAEQMPNGAIGRMSNRSIAAVIEYPGDPDKLIAAMVEARFLDEHPLHRLVVHNWHHRRDNEVDQKLFRTGQRYANGAIPAGTKLGRESKAWKEAYEKHWRTPASSLFEVPVPAPEPPLDPVSDSRLPKAALGSYPEPVPVPEPEPEPVPEPDPEPVCSAHAPSPRAAQALIQASQEVLLHCSVSGTTANDLQSSICGAIDSECQRLEKPPETYARVVAQAMITNHADYVKLGPALEYKWGLKRFFEEGHWRHWQNWPIDRERERQMLSANVGCVQ